MTLRQLVLTGLGVFCLAACTTVPFQEVDLVSVEGLNPEEVRGSFAGALPVKFRMVNTVTFEFKRRAFAAIGYADVDTSAKTFTVIGFHPAGAIKLFELSGDSEDVDCRFALEELTRWDDFARAVADDTKGIYFDRIPAPDAKTWKGKYRIHFRQQAPDGEIEYVFAGADGVLVEKRYYENGSRIWSASYYEYRRQDGKLYPGGIIFKHHEYGYQLTVRLKEIRS
jgi:hypothetical protein